jgi:hypothetical protein
MSYEAWADPREDGPTCRGCGAFLTIDEMQEATEADAHVCRISSNDLPADLIAYAQAGQFGDGWEVTPEGLGFVRFDDPLEARDVLRSLRNITPTPPQP